MGTAGIEPATAACSTATDHLSNQPALMIGQAQGVGSPLHLDRQSAPLPGHHPAKQDAHAVVCA